MPCIFSRVACMYIRVSHVAVVLELLGNLAIFRERISMKFRNVFRDFFLSWGL